MIEIQENTNNKSQQNSISINPATQLSQQSNPTNAKYIYVIYEDGAWGMHKHLKPLGAVRDELGWWINNSIENRNIVMQLCKQAGLTYLLRDDLPANDLETYGRLNRLEYHQEQAAKNKQEFDHLKFINKLEDIDINISLDDLKEKTKNEAIITQHKEYHERQKSIIRLQKEELVTRIQAEDKSSFNYLLENNSEEKLIEELTSLSPGVDTGYKIGDIDLKFPGGAVSIIAAPTSHGKTTALSNFTLGALEKNPEKSVYFFTYEECTSSILTLFLNTWVSKKLSEHNIRPISKKNRDSIDHYFRAKTDRHKFMTIETRNFFDTYKKNFFESLINTGRLRVFYSDKRAEELVESIRFIAKNDTNVGLICIDYMQLLKLQNEFKGSRQEALKDICLMLKDVAIETGLPIVLAAQFNRTVVSEADLSPVNIGEAGDIERVALLIIGMFNRNFQLNRDGNKDKAGKLIEKENAIYFEILKGRRIGNNHSCVMDFDGNGSRLINRNDNKPQQIEKEQPNNIDAQRLSF